MLTGKEKRGRWAVVVAAWLVWPAYAGPLEDGYYAAQMGNFEEAIRLWRPLADEGEPAAQFNLGYLYEHGKGVRPDFAEAMRWYRKAADQGDAAAQYTVGALYEGRPGVPQDFVQAHMWFSLAAASFPESRPEDRDRAQSARRRVAARMTAAQIAEAQKLASAWKPK